MTSDVIPRRTAARLPVYLRSLLKLKSIGLTTVSSKELAEDTMNNPAQIRKDLSFMGELGTRGLGYDIDQLIEEIRNRLALDRKKFVIVIGSELKRFPFWQWHIGSNSAFEIIGLFECSRRERGRWFKDVPIYNVNELKDFISVFPTDIAVIANTAGCDQNLIDDLADLGVKAVLNLTSQTLKVPDGTVCRQIDLSSELQLLSYYLAENSTEPHLPIYEHV